MILSKHKINGFYSWQIINANGLIVSQSPNKNNLILDQGLGYLENFYFADCFSYCCIGFGSIAPLLTDTGLLSEQKRTNNYYTQNNGCISFVNAGTFNIKRTFDFTPETETIQYGEIGWSPFGDVGNNLFSKTLMVDEIGNVGPITVGKNQFLRVIYTLQITPEFNTITPYSPSINGWTTNGNAASQLVGLMGVDASGVTSFYDNARDANEPINNTIDIFISTGRQGLSGFGESADRRGGNFSQRATSSYLSGSYSRTYSASFSRASGVGDISSIGIGLTGSSALNSTFIHLMDSPQTKATDYELNIYFTNSWGRA